MKVLYSKKGLYVLMEATDKKITATFDKDDSRHLWTEDVFEVFLWPDERDPIYFEYEISPLEPELPILVPNLGDKFLGWLPWHYEGERKTRKATVGDRRRGEVRGGGATAGGRRCSSRTSCSCRCGTCRRSRAPGGGRTSTAWTTTTARQTSWDWSRVGPSFHEFKKFGTLVFE